MMNFTKVTAVFLAIMNVHQYSKVMPTNIDLQKLGEATRFTLTEAEPLLQVLSRLDHVLIVKPSPYFPIGWPHICWLTKADDKLGVVNGLAWQFKGKAFWWLLNDMPRTCLVAEINDSTFSPNSFTSPDAGERLRAIASAEIPELAEFLETALNLKDKPSLGYEWSNRELELPLVEDRELSGRPVVITSDPERYAAREGFPTSDLDRTLHFWITEQEYDTLYADLEKLPSKNSYSLLRRIMSGSYENVVIRPEEVANLIGECRQFHSEISDSSLHAALSKIEAVGRSAQHYKLGICVPGG